VNPQIRRSLFFPAGVYRVSGSIDIPPYATLVGEGIDNSLIVMDNGVDDYVARTADSLQNTGVNIGDAGATPPTYITITNMGFSHADPTGNIFLVQDATNCRFQNVGFRGASTTADLDTADNGSIGINFSSTASLVCEQIIFDGCVFSGVVWGMHTDEQIKSVTVSNSQFDTLYRGIVLGTSAVSDGGATGTRIVSNMFNNIYLEGIIFGAYLELGINASGHNIFYDVGNHFTGSTGTPASSIISILSNNNVSISDLFERTNDFSLVYPRINLNDTVSIATTNGSQLAMGTYVRESGSRAALNANASGNVFELDAMLIKAFTVNYTIVTENYRYRTGTILVATDVGDSSLGINSSDDFVDNGNTGIALEITQAGDTISLDYINSTSNPATISYSITHLA
jgi:hypothetical protein